mgnify:CR=1 FL=1
MTKMAAIMGEEVVETGDFVVNEKDKIVNLTERGVKKVEKFFNIENLADPEIWRSSTMLFWLSAPTT